MFPYDSDLASALRPLPTTIAEVMALMQRIDSLCSDLDGLKWFNWLYLQVTVAVEARVAKGGFANATWLAQLDVQFAALYFNALYAQLGGASCSGCWKALFAARNQTAIARLQFALAGMNAHINHDLPLAIIATCRATNITPKHGTSQYSDYTAVNSTLQSLIDTAKQTLRVRLPGDPLPAVSHLEDTIAAWDLATAREKTWNTAESLWQEPAALQSAHLDVIDGLTTVIGKVLMVPVPA